MHVSNQNTFNKKINNHFDRKASKDIMNRKRINIIDFKYNLSNFFNHTNDNNKINKNAFNAKKSPQLVPLNNFRQRFNNQKSNINKEKEINEYQKKNNRNDNHNNKINVHISIDSISKQRKLPFIQKSNEKNNNLENIKEIVIGANNNNLEINSGYINNKNAANSFLNTGTKKKKKNIEAIYSINKKITLENIKNMNRKKIILANDDEKIVNIRMKENQNSNYYENYNNNSSKNFFKSKKENVQFCISHFANFNNDLMSMKNTLNHFENERNKNKLNKNKTIFGKKNKFLKNDEDEGEDIYYKSKYFLPSSGFGLLSRTNFKSKI